ncbi:hydrogenase maturation nickel metallochaperone HypA [Streptosporangium sp. NPDC020072]|uniref:hydrogenase maturation nickel metallochaperone HypA/HybF n=1 Tax=Streptosporangium sp. NPDC020072 TaxID=3154788 RepID=UPI00341AA81B
MHEFGVAEAILIAVEERAEGRRVGRARVHAGALLRVTEPEINHAFAKVAEGSLAEGAKVELLIVPAQLICRRCGQTAAAFVPRSVCVECDGTDVETVGGDDLFLDSVQFLESAQAAGPADVPEHA